MARGKNLVSLVSLSSVTLEVQTSSGKLSKFISGKDVFSLVFFLEYGQNHFPSLYGTKKRYLSLPLSHPVCVIFSVLVTSGLDSFCCHERIFFILFFS